MQYSKKKKKKKCRQTSSAHQLKSSMKYRKRDIWVDKIGGEIEILLPFPQMQY